MRMKENKTDSGRERNRERGIIEREERSIDLDREITELFV